MLKFVKHRSIEDSKFGDNNHRSDFWTTHAAMAFPHIKFTKAKV